MCLHTGNPFSTTWPLSLSRSVPRLVGGEQQSGVLLEYPRHLPLASGFLYRSLELRGSWRWKKSILAQAGEYSCVEVLMLDSSSEIQCCQVLSNTWPGSDCGRWDCTAPALPWTSQGLRCDTAGSRQLRSMPAAWAQLARPQDRDEMVLVCAFVALQ